MLPLLVQLSVAKYNSSEKKRCEKTSLGSKKKQSNGEEPFSLLLWFYFNRNMKMQQTSGDPWDKGHMVQMTEPKKIEGTWGLDGIFEP